MWNVLECAVQGRGHMRDNTPCQDKTYSLSMNGTHVIALADGAGSAKFSHYGAARVTELMCHELGKNFNEYIRTEDGVTVKRTLMNQIREALAVEAESLDCELKELASTLLVAAVKDEQFILVHIGDGVIGYMKDGEIKVASEPDNGEFANTTVFTTSNHAIQAMKMMKGNLGSITGFILLSDGSEASLYNKRSKELTGGLEKVMEFPSIMDTRFVQGQLEESFQEVIREQTTDDCSIAILTRENSEFQGYLALSYEEKCRLLDMPGRTPKRIIRRYNRLLVAAIQEITEYALARAMGLPRKYAKKYIGRLVERHFLDDSNSKYRTTLRLVPQEHESEEYSFLNEDEAFGMDGNDYVEPCGMRVEAHKDHRLDA